MLPPTLLALTFAILSLPQPIQTATADEWATRSIYQIMTDRFALANGSSPECDLLSYCGGTWKGIQNHLDYIQGMGFSAIQISPVVQNIPNRTIYGSAFHGYWPTNWYALNENFGTEKDLKELSEEVHRRGMLFMVDVVIGDMAVAISEDMTPSTVIDYSQFYPFNEEKYYHPWCNLTTYFVPEIFQNCWLGSTVVALPDLNTESPLVTSMVHDWIRELISNYTIDGLRIDAAKHVDDKFLTSFVEAAGVFTLGEVYNEAMDIVCQYSELLPGLPNFATYFPAIEGFAKGNLTGLGVMVEDVREGCRNVTLMGTFVENHDLPRFPSINADVTLAKNAIAWTLLAEGIPTIYQNQEHHAPGNYSPFNRGALWSHPNAYSPTLTPFYNLTHSLNAIRTHAILSNPGTYLTTPLSSLHLSPSAYVTRRGDISSGTQLVAAYFNNGSIPIENSNRTFQFQGGFNPNVKVVEVISCEALVTNEEGYLRFRLDGEPKAWFAAEKMEGSGLCGYTDVRPVPKEDADAKKNETSGGEGEKKSEGVRVAAVSRSLRGDLALVALLGVFGWAVMFL